MKKEDIEKLDLKQLLFIYFNLGFKQTNKKDLIIHITTKKSKYCNQDINYEKLFFQFNRYLNFSSSFVKNTEKEFRLKIFNHLNSVADFFEWIYELIVKNIIDIKNNFDINITEYISNLIILNLFSFRASVDFKLNYLSVDIKESTKKEERAFYYKKFFNLFSYLPFEVTRKINLNFRDFQPQYKSNENKRNTQIRINLFYFIEKYENSFKKINYYKDLIINQNIDKVKNKDDKSENFSSRFYGYLLYLENGSNKKNIDFIVINERNELTKRDNNIVNLAKLKLKDICFSCDGIYLLKDRTFKYRNSDFFYLEINHIIPFKAKDFADVNVDIVENLIKLCPTCHRILTKDRANEELQKKVIECMLKNYKYNNKNEFQILLNLIESKSKILDWNNLIDFIYNQLT